jgi:uncharacterized protein involved in type VI secretion and phage assembly
MCDGCANGVVVGIVTSLKDEEQLGRVKVRYPHLEDQVSEMARLATLMAGPNRGSLFLPDVDDEVLIAFEHGNVRRPYVVGSLWSTVDQPPAGDGDQKANNHRLIRSRSGAVIRFDDKSGAEKIEVVDKDAMHSITLDSAGKRIDVVTTTGDVNVRATAGTVAVTAGTVNVRSTGSMTLQASGVLTIRGSKVEINP